MDLFLYCYQTVYSLVIMAAIAICIYNYGWSKDRTCRSFGLFFAVTYFRVIFCDIAGILIGYHNYDALDRVFLVGDAIFTFLGIYLLGQALIRLSGSNLPHKSTLLLAGLCTILQVACSFSQSDFIMIVSDSMYYLGCIAVVLCVLITGKQTHQLTRPILFVILGGSICSIIEVSLNIASTYRFLDRYLPDYAYGIGFLEDLTLCIVTVLLILWMLDRRDQLTSELVQQQVQSQTAMLQDLRTEPADEQNLLNSFCSHYSLTPRESEVVACLIKGYSNQEIATELYISVGTVRTHMRNILDKLNVSSRGQVVSEYIDYKS